MRKQKNQAGLRLLMTIFAIPEQRQSADKVIVFKQQLVLALQTLKPLERQVIVVRFGIEDGNIRSFREVSRILNIGIGQAQVIESSALHKLQKVIPMDP